MIDAIEVEPGIWSVLDGTRVYEIRIAGEHVLINGRRRHHATLIAVEAFDGGTLESEERTDSFKLSLQQGLTLK